MTLEGQVALITGGSRGLGLSIAKALGAEGAAIACLARSGAELDSALATLTASGIQALGLAADVTKEADVERAVRATIERWGRLDLLVLNAGTWQGAKIHETTEAQWDLLVDLNLKGAFLALKHAIPWLTAQKHATIVGISSLGGTVGQPGSAAYAASKWGLRGLLESAALELKAQRVRVSIVHPHNMNSAGRAIEPGSPDRDKNLETADVASLVAWICTAPDHVSVGNVSIWPLAAGVAMK
jgi:NAD(P)-dependent dehydrogenase (short-subunit alcohol dehydrogenase family)